MGKNEKLQKELDFLLEKIRFWRYTILAIISGEAGTLFGISQNKIHVDVIVLLLLIFGAIGLVVAVKRIDTITKEYQKLLELLEKED